MPTNSLSLSSDGLEKIKKREGSIDGLYDDPSGYATYGVGHLVHPDKSESFLLDSAQADKLCDSRVKKQWPGTSYETPYLEREVIACKDYESLKTKAKERALDLLSQSKFKRKYADLSDGQKATVKTVADGAVDREAQLLNLPVADVLRTDIQPFEKAVNAGVTGVALVQDEFDALVSFAFNVGVPAFNGSGLLKKINENKYRDGAADQREKAIGEIEQAFLAWNKSGGKVMAGLTQRRQDEAEQFLKKAKDELNTLKATKAKGALWMPSRAAGVPALAAAAVRGMKPDKPA